MKVFVIDAKGKVKPLKGCEKLDMCYAVRDKDCVQINMESLDYTGIVLEVASTEVALARRLAAILTGLADRSERDAKAKQTPASDAGKGEGGE